jgi:hypothetical protein
LGRERELLGEFELKGRFHGQSLACCQATGSFAKLELEL